MCVMPDPHKVFRRLAETARSRGVLPLDQPRFRDVIAVYFARLAILILVALVVAFCIFIYLSLPLAASILIICLFLSLLCLAWITPNRWSVSFAATSSVLEPWLQVFSRTGFPRAAERRQDSLERSAQAAAIRAFVTMHGGDWSVAERHWRKMVGALLRSSDVSSYDARRALRAAEQAAVVFIAAIATENDVACPFCESKHQQSGIDITALGDIEGSRSLEEILAELTA